jgi:5'-nucleotidase
MRLSLFSLALAATSFVGVDGLNLLLTNDDSWASANIRAFYHALKAAGHVVLLVAPVVNQSGKGGTVSLQVFNGLCS